MKVQAVPFLFVLAFLFTSCNSVTVQQVVDKHKDFYATKREQLKQIAATLPDHRAVPKENDAPSVLDPKPVYRNSYRKDPMNGKFEGNMEIIGFDQLLNPDDEYFSRPYGDQTLKFDLINGIEGDFLTCLKLTGPNPKSVANYSFTRVDNDHFDDRCQNGMNVRYLTIYRKAPFGGKVDVFVADLENGKILSFFTLKGDIDFTRSSTVQSETVTVLRNSTQEQRERAESEVRQGAARRESLRPYDEYQKKMAQDLIKTFNGQTGGEIGNLD